VLLASGAFAASSETPSETQSETPSTTPTGTPPGITLERLFSDPPLQGNLPRQAVLSPGGAWVGFLKPSAADSEELELWAQPATGGAPVRLVSSHDLLGGQAEQLSEAEKMALQRKRISEHGITAWQWCGRDDHRLLFPLSGALYVVRLEADGPHAHRLPAGDGDAGPARDPQCSPDGRQVAFVRGGNLWVQSLEEGGRAPRRLTDDATETRYYGLAEFIAAEELARQRGFWWSPDGRRLLALHVDESQVALKTRAQIFADHTDFTQQRYPGAGTPNARVDALVIDVDDGRQTPLARPADAEYVARADWFEDGTPWLQVLTRDQTRLALIEYDPRTAAPHRITEEHDAAWVETHDDLAEVKGLRLSGKPALLWPSEAGGRRQLLLVDRVTGARRALTTQAEPVSALVCAGANELVFEGATDRGRGRELFVTDLQGHVRPVGGAEPRQWRSASGDRDCRRLLVKTSTWGQPWRLELRDVRGTAPAVALQGDAPDPRLAGMVTRPQVMEMVAADGATPLSAFWFAPAAPPAAGARVPVIVLAYGGPTAQTVVWSWARDVLLIARWQQRGYGVFMIDPRGMNPQGRDRAYTRAHFHAFGQVEVDDLFGAVRQLAARRPEVDAAHVGFFGWSYGGFLAARAVLDANTPFAAAVAVAPVTDFRLYDTAYTERYLGLPTLPDGSESPFYKAADLVPRAGLLARPLLLMHGTADDNVLFENSLRLIQALEDEGKLFELEIYPGKAHGISGRKAQLHVYKTIDAFFDRNLRPAAR